jgi:hypothetical protein
MRFQPVVLGALVAMSGVACEPGINLRKPICFVTTGNRALTTTLARTGAQAWLDPLERASGTKLPEPRYVSEMAACRGNPPIIVRMTCGRRRPVGVIYYRRSLRAYELFLNEQTFGLWPGVVSHEIGHALLTWAHVTNRLSLMNPYLGDPDPTPTDIELLYQRHPELSARAPADANRQGLRRTAAAAMLRRFR